MNKLQDAPVRYLKGIGPKKAKIFQDYGLNTLEDLLYYFPRRYEDRRSFSLISKLEEGKLENIKAKILAKGQRNSWKRRGFGIFELVAEDKSGRISCIWFNQPYLYKYFQIGQEVILYGKVERYSGKLQMSNPEFEIVSKETEDSLNIGRITPVYSLPKGFTQRFFRRIIKNALEEGLSRIQDFLPYDLRSRNNLLNLAKSLLEIHFPAGGKLQEDAYKRLSFEEFFLFQVPLALRKIKRKEKKGIAHKIEGSLINDFIQSLPFKLTNAQEKVLFEIKKDMSEGHAMQRLLQGDVGSGKTVIATLAALIAIEGGYQAVFMVPTEILAYQHIEKIKYQISKIKNREVRVELLTGSIDKKDKERILQEIQEGKIDLVIGTHAIISGSVSFKKLGLVVIDEQHKFGVGQRALLPEKGTNPDILIMTATPIPRTLSITLYGDLDISVINELPPGRGKVKTMHFHSTERNKAYDVIKDELRKGGQAYIIYPVIEESYVLDTHGAQKMYQDLSRGEFRDFKLGLIHGRLKQSKQDEVMDKFKNKDLDILVATTVLEVGIDVSGANCMLVENAERFGLSQLHQLRGRIGRGEKESSCLLISDADTQEARARIDAMVRYNDGFRIAEEDLKIRGPGEFFGQRQHGLSELRIADPLKQMKLLKVAREEAVKLINQDPGLTMKQNVALKDKILQRFPQYEELIMVG